MGIGMGLFLLSQFIFILAAFHILYSSVLVLVQLALLVWSFVRHKKSFARLLPN